MTPGGTEPPARTGGGDPDRTLALLWRAGTAAPRHGPARRLNLDDVIAAAVALADADAEGLAALSMRRLGTVLEVTAMTLYTYVPGKAELLDLMLDSVYLQMPRADTSTLGWRDRASAVARENLAMFDAHPWAAEVATSRPPLGPGCIAKYEHELGALSGLGLSDVATDDTLTFLLTFVQSCARASAQARAAVADTGVDDATWWAANAPLLSRVLDEEAYPLAVRIGAAAGAAHGSAHNPEHAYAFGLERVLDGLAALPGANL